MSVNTFTQSPDYQDFKKFMFYEFKEKKADIKTDGKSIETIAIQAMATEIAIKKLEQAFRRYENKKEKETLKTNPLR